MTALHECTKCGRMLPRTADYFYRFAGNKDGLRTHCKDCHNDATKQYAETNIDKTKMYRQLHWQKNKAERSREFKKYYENNKAKICKTRVEYTRRRLKRDAWFRALYMLRSRVYHAIRNEYSPAARKSTKLLGCDFPTLKVHITSLFSPGMTWEKVLSGEIHLDHRIPCSKFDLTIPEQQKACFHYTNMQPLWAADNLSKRNKTAS